MQINDNQPQLYLIQNYNTHQEFIQPQDLLHAQIKPSNSQEQQTDYQVNDPQQQPVPTSTNKTKFDQTPIHKYSSRPITMQTPQGSQAEEDEQKRELQRTKLILEFKVSELQKICSTLTSANSKLLDKIEQLQEQNDRQKSRIVRLQKDMEDETQGRVAQSRIQHNYYGGERQHSQNQSQDNNYINEQESVQQEKKQGNQQLQQDGRGLQQEQQAVLQSQVGDIQQLIREYRQELKRAEQINKENKRLYEEKIAQFQQAVQKLTTEVNSYIQLNLELEQKLEESDQQLMNLEAEITQLKAQAVGRNGHFGEYRGQNYAGTKIMGKADSLGVRQQDTPRTQSNHSTHEYYLHNIDYQNVNTNNLQYASRYGSNANHMYGSASNGYKMMYSDPISCNNANSHNFNNANRMTSTQLLSSTVQVQLEKLINKLVRELQAERGSKHKISSQMRRVQFQLLETEKQITFKNKRIHQLEMELLNYQKQNILQSNNVNKNINTNIKSTNSSNPMKDRNRTGNNTDNSINTNNNNFNNTNRNSNPIKSVNKSNTNTNINTASMNNKINYESPQIQPKTYNKTNHNNRLSKDKQSPKTQTNKLLQSATLQQLLNNPNFNLTLVDKIYIGLKLIQLYEHKVSNQNLIKLTTDNILVNNYNTINPRLVKLKPITNQNQYLKYNTNNSLFDQEAIEIVIAANVEQLIQNLLQLLSAIFFQQESSQHGQQQQEILGKIMELANNPSKYPDILTETKALLECVLDETANGGTYSLRINKDRLYNDKQRRNMF